MFCRNCGNQMSDNARFCSKCGTPAQPAPPAAPVQPEQPVQPVQQEAPVPPEQPAQAQQELPEQPVQQTQQEAPEQPIQQTQQEAPVHPEQPAQQEAPVPPEQPAQQELPEPPEQPTQQIPPASPEQPAQQEAPVPPVEPIQQVPPVSSVQPVPVPPVQPVPDGTAAKAKKKKPPKKKAGKAKAAIVLAVIAAVAAAAAFWIVTNASAVGNFVHKTFTSPQQYYQYVEAQTAKQLASQSGAMYGTMLKNWLNVYDRNFSEEFSVELSEEGREYLALLGLAGVDLTWLRSAAVGMNYSVRDSLIGLDASAALNGEDIISANILIDMEEAGMYFRFPELTQTYLGINMEMLEDSGSPEQIGLMRRQQELSRQLMEKLPSQTDVEELVNRYMEIVLECIEDVSVGSQNVKAGGVEQRLTELEVTIDAKTAQKIAQAVLRTARSDKTIEKLIVNLVTFTAETDNVPLDADAAYDAFCDEINDALAAVQDLGDSDGEIIMKVYVNNKGEIKGRVLEWTRVTAGNLSIDSSGVTESVRMLMTEKGTEFGFELSADSGDEGTSLTGSGIRTEGEMSGDFKLEHNGTSLADISVSGLNIEKAEAGLIDGNFEVKFSPKIVNLLNLPAPGRAFLTNLKLSLAFTASENVQSVAAGIVYNEEKLGTVTVTVGAGRDDAPVVLDKNNTIMITNQYEAGSAAAEWMKTIDGDTVVSQLEKAGLPDSMLQQVQEILEIVEQGNIGRLILRGIYGASW